MFEQNERVEFTETLIIEPVIEIAQGETGRVEVICAAGDVWVRLDREHADLAAWQNCVYLPAHFEPEQLLARKAVRAA